MDIFVAKLNSDTTAEHLEELFGKFGKVISSRVIMDRQTGMSKCFGFIEIENEIEVADAIEHLNESKFMGNTIVVKQSEPRSQEKRTFNHHSDGGEYHHDGNRRFSRNHDRENSDHKDHNRERIH